MVTIISMSSKELKRLEAIRQLDERRTSLKCVSWEVDFQVFFPVNTVSFYSVTLHCLF